MQEAWNRETHRAIHDRWIEQLKMDLPTDVPVRVNDPTWPETILANLLDEEVIETEPWDEALHQVRQCLFCRYYCDLIGDLGMDWGACLKAGGQYDRQVVFEHWTCRDFENSPDAQDAHPEYYRRMAESHEEMARMESPDYDPIAEALSKRRMQE